MKKILVLLVLVAVPSVGFAKYCPTCLKTFQQQTVRGQTKTIYQWMLGALNQRKPIKYNNLKILFNKKVRITVNGKRVAYGTGEAYRYLLKMRQQQVLLNAQLQSLLVDGRQAAIQYQTISQRRGRKYRTLTIAILRFRGHQLLSWSSVRHTRKI